MKNKFEKTISLLFVLCLAFTACSDWQEIESITIEEPNTAEQEPELYARYLHNLREYKKSEHKVVYAWFDNSEKGFQTRADHFTDLPDSIDIVSLESPELTQEEVKELQQVRTDKGTKFVYTIKYTDIENQYAMAFPETELLSDDQFLNFMDSYMTKALSWCEVYDYDGLNICYTPKNSVHMEDELRLVEENRQKEFMRIVAQWVEGHQNNMLLLDGNFMYLTDKSILKKCAYLLVDASNVETVEGLTRQIKNTIIEGIPTDRFIACVPTFSLNPEDKETGYFFDSRKGTVSAIQETAYWVLTPESGIQKAGLGIYNIKNDYYNPSVVYPNSRIAVTIMNPSPNN